MSPETRPTRTPESADDRDLLRHIAAGSAAALEELSRRFLPLLRAEAGRVLGDRDEAEDIAQEVLWKVWRRAGEYDPARASAGTWLTVLTRRAAIDRLRQRQRHLRLVESQPRENSAVLPEAPESALVRSSFAPVRRAIRDLPREQRQILELTYFRDMSQREIARATGLPLGTIKSRAHLAMKKLRTSLAVAS
jgi:RNA polymerase sigma-70 factor (ECF subfamily)